MHIQAAPSSGRVTHLLSSSLPPQPCTSRQLLQAPLRRALPAAPLFPPTTAVRRGVTRYLLPVWRGRRTLAPPPEDRILVLRSRNRDADILNCIGSSIARLERVDSCADVGDRWRQHELPCDVLLDIAPLQRATARLSPSPHLPKLQVVASTPSPSLLCLSINIFLPIRFFPQFSRAFDICRRPLRCLLC